MKRKTVTIALVLALVAVAVVGGTLAYFTDEVKATNTFTVGNVDILLTETNWDLQGKIDAATVYAGEPLAKNPVVTNDGENPCFVRINVEGLEVLGEDLPITYRTDYVDGKLGTDWVLHTDGYFYYKKVLAVGDITDALFDQIVMPTGLTNGDGTTEYNVIVTAQAVQAQGAKAPNWVAVQGMTVAEIAAWFTTCGL